MLASHHALNQVKLIPPPEQLMGSHLFMKSSLPFIFSLSSRTNKLILLGKLWARTNFSLSFHCQFMLLPAALGNAGNVPLSDLRFFFNWTNQFSFFLSSKSSSFWWKFQEEEDWEIWEVLRAYVIPVMRNVLNEEDVLGGWLSLEGIKQISGRVSQTFAKNYFRIIKEILSDFQWIRISCWGKKNMREESISIPFWIASHWFGFGFPDSNNFLKPKRKNCEVCKRKGKVWKDFFFQYRRM